MLLSFRCSGLTEGIPWFSRAHERRLRVKDGLDRQRRFSDGPDIQDGERSGNGALTEWQRRTPSARRQFASPPARGKEKRTRGWSPGRRQFTRSQGLTCFRGDLARSQAAQCPTRFAPVAFPIPLHPMPSTTVTVFSGLMRDHRCGRLPSRCIFRA